MLKKEIIENNKKLKESLKIDCANCFGFCCAALCFMKAEGFLCDKAAGVPCSNLNDDYKCKIHTDLKKKGFHGCTVYDCLGAGQKVSQVICEGKDWRSTPEKADEIFNIFITKRMYGLFEIMKY